MESWQSGRLHRLGKAEVQKWARGFKSHRFLQILRIVKWYHTSLGCLKPQFDSEYADISIGDDMENTNPAHNGVKRHSIGGVSKKFQRTAELYKRFAVAWDGLDFSNEAMIEMYNAESYGGDVDKKKNGFYIGKQWMNVNIAMWKEDQEKGHLCLSELYEDFPHWWLDGIFKNI